MLSLGNISMRKKLIFVMVLPTMAAVSILLIAVVANDLRLFLTNRAEYRSLITENVADCMALAVAVDDPELARCVLADTSRDNPDMISARVVKSDGAVLAEYARARPEKQSDVGFVPAILTNRLSISRPVSLDGTEIGVLSMDFTGQSLISRLEFYGLVALVAALASAALAACFAYRSERLISEPIAHLAHVVETASENAERSTRSGGYVTACREDHSVQAIEYDADEVVELIDAFNNMLESMQRRDSDLQAVREELETRITHRASELLKRSAALPGAPSVVCIDMDNLMSDIQEALASADGLALARAAGDIKRVAAYFGAKAAYDAASQIEALAHSPSGGNPEGACQLLQREMDRLKSRLGHVCGMRRYSSRLANLKTDA